MALTQEALLRHLVDEYGLEDDDVQAGTLLFSTGLLDSFTLVEVVQHLESQSGLKIRPIDFTLDNLDSVERMMAFLATRG